MPDSPATRRWRALVQAHAVSGLTNRAFAQQMGVNPRTLAWWRSELKRRDASAQLAVRSPQFAEVTLTTTRVSPTLVLTFDDRGAHVSVDASTDLSLLRQVAEALR